MNQNLLERIEALERRNEELERRVQDLERRSGERVFTSRSDKLIEQYRNELLRRDAETPNISPTTSGRIRCSAPETREAYAANHHILKPIDPEELDRIFEDA